MRSVRAAKDYQTGPRTPNILLSSPCTLTIKNCLLMGTSLSPFASKSALSRLQAPHHGWLNKYITGLSLWEMPCGAHLLDQNLAMDCRRRLYGLILFRKK